MIVATATDADGNTSEFSPPAVVSEALLAAGGEAESRPSVTALNQTNLDRISNAAIERLAAIGYRTELFESVEVAIADLPAATLGRSTNTSVFIDMNAAGYGWFVDVTPQEDSEFASPETPLLSRVTGRGRGIDLLTVVMHELGHLAGLADLYQTDAEDDLMHAWLEAGIRKTSLEASLIDGAFAEF